MKRSHGWFVLALTAACSSESPPDGTTSAIASTDPSQSASQPVDTGASPAMGAPAGAVTTPTPAQLNGPTTSAPGVSTPRPPTTPPTPVAPPTQTMTTPPQMNPGASGSPGGVLPTIPGIGGAGPASSGGESGVGGSLEIGGADGAGEVEAGGAPTEQAGGAGPGNGAAGAPVDEGGECAVGTTTGNEVVIIGESFIAASSIGQDLSQIAIDHGSLQGGDSYINNSVSGTRLGDGAIPGQYTRAAESNSIRFVLMDGGGNDCLQANDSNSPITAAEGLFEQMASDGVEKVVYFFYPDPAGMFGGSSSSLKTCLDELRPKMKAVCDGLTSPECYWLDLRETSWTGNETAYTSDGIHPNAEGSQVTAEAIWEVMEANCVAQ